MSEGRAPARWVIAAFVVSHVVVRLLSPHIHYFWETDDPAIAAGIAALLTGSPGDTYRYAPQAGYYRLVEALAWVSGRGVPAIPELMITLSTLSSLAVPLLALGTFPRELRARERFAWALVLAANPILFWSGRYGNTAIVSIALTAACFFLASRARTARGEIAGLACFVAAVWVRADAILVAPALALWLYHRHGSLLGALKRLAGLGTALAVLYAVLFWLDPRMSELADDVGSHVTSTLFVSMFFDYFVLAFSPIPIFLAVWGARGMLDAQPRLLALVSAWCIPTAAFYFLTLTTPRYFMALVVPVSLCGAMGALEGIDRCARRAPRKLAAFAVAGLAALHLVVPVDRWSPGSPFAVLQRANVMTHDGPMHTGAFLYHALFHGGFLRWSWRGGDFGEDAGFAQSARTALAELSSAEAPRRVFVAVSGFPECAFYYELYRAGAVVTEVMPMGSQGADASHSAPTRWRLGRSEVITATPPLRGFEALTDLPMGPMQEIWFTRAEDESRILARVHARVEPGRSLGPPFRVLHVIQPSGETP